MCGLRNSRGSVMFTLVTVLAVFLLMCTFVIDTGYLAANKHTVEDAVEAAALSAAYRLCEQDPYDTALHVLKQYVTISDRADLDVVRGYYDEYDSYPDFSKYSEFASVDEGDFPDEHVNAVLVALSLPSQSLSGLNEDRVIHVSAVAYLKRYGMIAGGDDGEIRIGFNNDLADGVIHAHTIKYPASVSGSSQNPPTFDNVLLTASGQVLACSTSLGLYGHGATINWDSCSPSRESIACHPVEKQEVPPLDDDYLDYMKSIADKIYTPDQAGADTMFWGSCPDSGNYYFDLSGDRSTRTIVFFDTETLQGDLPTVCIQDGGGLNDDRYVCPDLSHTTNDARLNNITFVTQAHLKIQTTNHLRPGEDEPFHFGEKGERQCILMAGGNVDINYSMISYDGVVIRANGSFTAHQGDSKGIFNSHLRIIAGKDIDLENLRGDIYFDPGPPCPPSIACLGRLD